MQPTQQCGILKLMFRCIGNEEVRTGDTKTMSAPHDHKHIVGTYHQAQNHMKTRLQPHFKLKRLGQIWPGNNALEFFLKAAELLAGPYRAKINAATMIAQSKTVYQAEIDASCELIDFCVSTYSI
jgi:1-pyrroline-5-carboxylate dehydrogenase